ncbi:hypothetical protein DL93DRAFT_2228228 [Clavulina sp. PMI_390]|nr:hypothetical protein DL93DRAFT_2228228 [Clavulina sp. PMI_390]
MSQQRFFEIDQAIYHGPQLKPGASYRLAIGWNGPDLSNESMVKSKQVKPSDNDGDSFQCIWSLPSTGKRFFNRLPDQVSITIQYHRVHIKWTDVVMFTLDCAKDYKMEDVILNRPGDSQLVLRAAIVGNPAALAPPVPNITAVTSEAAAHDALATSSSTATTNSLSTARSSAPLDAQLVADQTENVFASLPVPKPSPVVTMVDQVSGPVTRASEAASTLNAGFPMLLDVLERFMKIGDVLAQAHPIAAAAWSVVNVAWQIIKANSALDGSVQGLVTNMHDTCQLVACYESGHPNLQEAVQAVLHQVVKGGYILKKYGKVYNQRFSSFKTYFSNLQQDVDACSSELESLHKKLSEHTSAVTLSELGRISQGVEQLVAKEYFQELQYAEAADSAYRAHAPDSGCLPGTCTEILNAIVSWISGGSQLPNLPPYLNLLVPDQHVLWLCGVAGSGKSSIALSVANSLGDLSSSIVWGFYRFSTANQAALDPKKLFSTLASQLAAQNQYLYGKLLEIIKGVDSRIRTSLSPKEQLNTFLLPLLRSLETCQSAHHAVIIIDAIDEAGNMRARAEILSLLAGLGPNLPLNVQVLITSRFEDDVHKALQLGPEDRCMLHMSQISRPSTEHDILLYVNHMLKNAFELPAADYAIELTQLAVKSEESFQWASTACLYIINSDDGNAGESAEERLTTVLNSNRHGLYELYRTVLTSKFGSSPKPMLQAILAILVVAQEPLSTTSYSLLGQPEWDPKIKNAQAEVYRLVRCLASLISGTENINHPLVPLHTSFTDFLQDDSSGEYIVKVPASHMLMALGCMHVMQDPKYGLHFNICQLETSFKHNSEVENLPVLIEQHICGALLYACHFWATHLAALTTPNTSLLKKTETLLCTAQLLHWIEVMSLTNVSPATPLSLLKAKGYKLDLGMSDMVQEALHFVSYFAIPIAVSAPHIYLSAMPFIPSMSPLRTLEEDFQNTMSVTVGALDTWPALRQTLQHGERVAALALSKNGWLLAAGLGNGTICLWDLRSGELVPHHHEQPMSQGHPLYSMALSPDGKLLASSGSANTICLWNVQSQSMKGEPLRGHDSSVYSVAFSPDGKLLASGSKDNTICLWDVQSQTRKGEPLRGHDHYVDSVVFSPDGTLLASGSMDNTLCFWDIQSGTAKGEPFKVHNPSVYLWKSK